MTRRRNPKRGLAYGEGYTTVRGDGKVQARWYEGGAWKAKTFTAATTDDARKLAEAHCRKMDARNRSGHARPPLDMTVRELVEEWLARGAAKWAPSSTFTWQSRAKTHVIPEFGAVKVTDLTPHQVQRWVDRMHSEGQAPWTIDCNVRVLVGAYREAIRFRLVDENPASGVTKPRKQSEARVTWTVDHIARVVAHLRDKALWNALYRLALTTGMRPGELRALKWSDLNWDTATIIVRRTITKDAHGHVIAGTRTKTNRTRAIAVPASAIDALAVWSDAQTAQRLLSPEWQDDEWMFTTDRGSFLPLTTWQHQHDKIIRSCKVPAITLHSLRHTHATLEMEAGTSPKIVADRLGHKDVGITLSMYSHVNTDVQRAASDAFDARVFGGNGDDFTQTSRSAPPKRRKPQHKR